jgi:hypothetical protein
LKYNGGWLVVNADLWLKYGGARPTDGYFSITHDSASAVDAAAHGGASAANHLDPFILIS